MPDTEQHDGVRDDQDAECAGFRARREGRLLQRDRGAPHVAPAASTGDASAWARHAARANGFGGDLDTIASSEPST
jgi:hypothetical protein